MTARVVVFSRAVMEAKNMGEVYLVHKGSRTLRQPIALLSFPRLMPQGFLFLALTATAAWAQSIGAGAAAPPSNWAIVTVTGSLRSRLYGWDWFQQGKDGKFGYLEALFRF